MATKKKTTKKAKVGAVKKVSPLQAAQKSYRTAKADLKAGKSGASQKLDKAVSRIAKLKCSTKK